MSMRWDIELTEVIKQSFYPDDHPQIQKMEYSYFSDSYRRKKIAKEWVTVEEASVSSQTDLMGKSPQAWATRRVEHGDYYSGEAILLISDDRISQYGLTLDPGTIVRFQGDEYEIGQEVLPKTNSVRYYQLTRRPGRR